MENKISYIIIEYLCFLLLGLFIGILIGKYRKIPEDVDNNGKVDSRDLLIVKKYLIKEGK